MNAAITTARLLGYEADSLISQRNIKSAKFKLDAAYDAAPTWPVAALGLARLCAENACTSGDIFEVSMYVEKTEKALKQSSESQEEDRMVREELAGLSDWVDRITTKYGLKR